MTLNRETLVSSGVHIGAILRLGSSYSVHHTSSPGRKLVTFSPTASTVPATS